MRIRTTSAVVFAVAAIGLTGAASASATSLCTSAACTTTYVSGTRFDGLLRTGTLATITTTGGTLGVGTISCSRANFTMQSTNNGGFGLDVSMLITAFGLGTCTSQNGSNCDATAVVGNLSVSGYVTATGGNNGNLNVRQPSISFGCGPVGRRVTCTFGGGGPLSGTITGGAPAAVSLPGALRVPAPVADCPTTATLAVAFTLTSGLGHPPVLFVGL